ncbi:hypothetical protein NQ314_009284 [Rhamnusium bicolor]|uniref:TIMELESS-interacting protein n=1 Tax=Rhamnusium bicolor TaxID=1586634 RepID=A0AAV8Y3X7_9CUCU|nr:hypothetical protein NQ314_009284 [Rhamnusium bicolor]
MMLKTQIKRIRLDLNVDDPDKPILSDEEANDTGGFVDTCTSNDQFDQLLPTSSEPIQEMTEEQLERMRQNKERAERLREERLRKIREKAQNNLGESNRISTQSTHETESTEHPLIDIVVNSNCSQEEGLNTNENGNELKSNQVNTQGSQASIITECFNVSTVDVQNIIDQRTHINENEESENGFDQHSKAEDLDDILGNVGEKNAIKKKETYNRE